MDLPKVFHMNGGRGTTSYSQNSSLQKRAAERAIHITTEAITQMFLSTKPKSLSMADLGCSSGPNTLSNIKKLIETIEKTCESVMEPAPEFIVYLNDLFTNDFNTVFRDLPEFFRELNDRRIYVGAFPGSFYGRVFPDKCLNFVYSFNSLHWLSKIPSGIYDEQGSSLNKNSIHISERSSQIVSQAYYQQFQEDFSLFLRSRSEEMIPYGKMVLMFLCRTDSSHSINESTFFWEILYQSFSILVSEGEIPAEKLESYDVHFYAPSLEEVEAEVKKEGLFELDLMEVFEVERDAGNCRSYGVAVARAVRSIQESMIVHHFGDGILDEVFEIFGRLVDQELAKQHVQTWTVVVVLTKS